jgi:hypothetical protein
MTSLAIVSGKCDFITLEDTTHLQVRKKEVTEEIPRIGGATNIDSQRTGNEDY